MTGWILFAIGALICAVNFYTSWVRYPLHRLRGGAPEAYRWVSGIPLVGTLLVMLAWARWLRLEGAAWIDVTALLLVLIDSGGPHWMIGTVVTNRMRR